MLFPLLGSLLETPATAAEGDLEETRLRCSALLCKVFLQHLAVLVRDAFLFAFFYCQNHGLTSPRLVFLRSACPTLTTCGCACST